jgi:ATP-binding cassette, subfamily B, bacterial
MADRAGTIAGTVRRFWPILRPQKRQLWFAFTASVLASGFAVVAPMPVKIIIDDVLAGRRVAMLPPLSPGAMILWLSIAAALLAALSAWLSASEKIISARIRERMTLDLRMICLDRLLLLTPLCRTDDRSGELGLRLVDDVQQVARLFTKTAPVILRHALTLLFALGAMVWISPHIGVGALVIAILLGGLVRLSADPLRRTARDKRVQEGRIAGQTQEILRALSFIQASGADDDIRSRFAKSNRDSLGAGVNETRAAVRLERTMQIANGLAVALVIGGGGWLALAGRISAGDLAIAVIYLNQMLRPIEKINELVSAVVSATSRAARLSELLDRDEQIDRSGDFQSARSEGAIRLDGLAFRYIDGRRFDYDTIDLPARSLISIEGPSGSGKSTLIALMTRLFDPEIGTLKLDGKAYQEWDLASLRSQFAISPQSPPLMSGTIGDWMRLGVAEASDDRLWDALDKVSLSEMLRSRSGLDTPIGDNGAGFSGGEQARIALARALDCDRPILLLDEPFANVDPVSAKVMLGALAREKGKRTIIIVTHQPLPADFADVQLKMAEGRLSLAAPTTLRKLA